MTGYIDFFQKKENEENFNNMSILFQLFFYVENPIFMDKNGLNVEKVKKFVSYCDEKSR